MDDNKDVEVDGDANANVHAHVKVTVPAPVTVTVNVQWELYNCCDRLAAPAREELVGCGESRAPPTPPWCSSTTGRRLQCE